MSTVYSVQRGEEPNVSGYTGAVWVDARQEMVKNFFRACVPLRHSVSLFLFLPVPGKALSQLIDDKPGAVAAVAPAHHVRRAVDLRPDRPIRPLGEAARHLGESAVLVSADGDAAPVLAAQLRRRYLAAHVAADQGWRAAIARQEAQRVERLGEVRVRGEAAAGAVLDPLVPALGRARVPSARAGERATTRRAHLARSPTSALCSAAFHRVKDGATSMYSRGSCDARSFAL